MIDRWNEGGKKGKNEGWMDVSTSSEDTVFPLYRWPAHT